MKKLKILVRIVMLFFLFGCFNACEKEDVMHSDDDDSGEIELAVNDELAILEELSVPRR